MKLLLENWRKYVAEATTLDPEVKQGFKQAILDSNFWTQPNMEDDVDEVGGTANMGSPASETLMSALNAKAEELGTDLNFVVTVTTEEGYELAPDDQYEGYPNNWMMQAQYRGPQDGLHTIWVELRPISEEYDMDDLNAGELAMKVSTTINHELVHYNQLKKQAANKGVSDEEAFEQMMKDPKQLSKSGEYGDYISRHIEVDAFAHEAAEDLLSRYSAEEALNKIKRKDAGSSRIVADYIKELGDNPKEIRKFWKKLYTQIMDQSQ